MERTCGYCHEKLNEGDEILKDLPVDEKERFADASKGLFGVHVKLFLLNIKNKYKFCNFLSLFSSPR